MFIDIQIKIPTLIQVGNQLIFALIDISITLLS